MAIQHFLTLFDLSADELKQLIQRAINLKALQRSGKIYEPLKIKRWECYLKNPPRAPECLLRWL